MSESRMNPGIMIAQLARRVGLGFADVVAPHTCLVCGAWIGSEEARACKPCTESLDRLIRLPACSRCGRSAVPLTVDEKGCGRCRREGFWNLAEVVRVGPYERPLRDVIIRLKYAGEELLADYLGQLLADAITVRPWSKELDLLVPVPMHWLRRFQRPCDHARLLADAVGRRLGVGVRRAVVRRVRYAPSQTNARTAHERFEHVKDCFAARAPAKLKGKTVCLIDNLLVSGATLHELSKVLRAAGARRIYAAVVGRSARGGDRQAATAAFDQYEEFLLPEAD